MSSPNKTLSITDLSSSTENLVLPSIQPVYKSPSSGFLKKVKVMTARNSVVYLPTLHRTLTEYHFQRSKTLDKRPHRVENGYYPAQQSSPIFEESCSTVPTSFRSRWLQSEGHTKQMFRSLPDTLEQEFCNTDKKNSKQFVSISQTIALHEEKNPNKSMLPPIDLLPKHKIRSVPSNPTASGSFSTKPNPKGPYLKRGDRTPKFHRSQTDLRRAPVHHLSFMVSGQSVRDGMRTEERTQQPNWKTGCLCMRCDMIQQQYDNKDMNAYHMWGQYPCNHPEAACEADDNNA